MTKQTRRSSHCYAALIAELRNRHGDMGNEAANVIHRMYSGICSAVERADFDDPPLWMYDLAHAVDMPIDGLIQASKERFRPC